MRKAFRKPGFKGIGKASGAAVGKIAIKVYVCRGCGLQHKADKPVQCMDCGRMDFEKFDSIGETNRYAELLLRVHAGMISNLETQVRFPLMAHRADGVGVKVGEYWADFTYTRDGKQVIEDFKGAITDVAQLKLRWMTGMGLPVTIITAKGKHNG
jgi:hypothetical protein